MDFDFSDEQYSFQETTRSFLDANSTIEQRRAFPAKSGIDADGWQKLVSTGVFSMLVPEAFEGLGLTFTHLALVLEEYGRGLVAAPVADVLVATDVISRFATPQQQSTWMPGLASGRLMLVPAVAEYGAGYSPDKADVTATRAGSGWMLSGKKMLVPEGATADGFLGSVRFAESGDVGLVLIERARAGVTSREHATLDLSSRYSEIAFDGVRIERADILGGNASSPAVARLHDVSAGAAALMMTGIAAKVLDDTVAYVTQRVQFGKPIGSFQSIKHRCADMMVAIESARAAAYYAAWAIGEDSADRAKAVSMAKSMCGDTARFVTNEGIQLHGGIGFTWGLGLHAFLRRARMLEYSYGDTAYHRERVLAATLAELGGKGT